MRHPASRAERRHVRATYMSRRRRLMRNWSAWSSRKDPRENLWWNRCAKFNGAHGCCMCHFEKYSRKYVRKRRQALKDSCQSVSWQQEY